MAENLAYQSHCFLLKSQCRIFLAASLPVPLTTCMEMTQGTTTCTSTGEARCLSNSLVPSLEVTLPGQVSVVSLSSREAVLVASRCLRADRIANEHD